MAFVWTGKRIPRKVEKPEDAPDDWKPPNSSFYVLPSGAVYEDFDGNAHRVGDREGDTIKVRTKYAKKYGSRLKQIGIDPNELEG
jgi:hypothetical protein